MGRTLRFGLAATVAVFAALLVGGAVALPYLYNEVFMACGRLHCYPAPRAEHPEQYRARPGTAAGTVVDGFWRVEQIAPNTYAIGEPAEEPDNYEYLLVGEKRALLIDAGATKDHDIGRVIAGLTKLPVTVLPSHLHFDHTNGLRFARNIALVDLPETRARAHGDEVRLGRYQYEGWSPVRFRVSEWVRPGQTIDLGGRQVQVLSTPGHTTSSISVWEPAGRRLYTGDLIYPTTLYAFGPDSSLSAYIATFDRLLAMLPADTRIYGAHCCRNDAPPHAPWLTLGDVRDARAAIGRVIAGTATGGRGIVIHRYPVNPRMTMLTLYPFGNR